MTLVKLEGKYIFFLFYKKRCPTLVFSPVSWVRLQTYKFTYTYDTQTRNNNLWITQRVAQCGNRTRCTLRGSRLPSHRANRAVQTKWLGVTLTSPFTFRRTIKEEPSECSFYLQSFLCDVFVCRVERVALLHARLIKG
ncbi:hypothetical protein SFRURICE_018774 [Spodoptera frugiperda]|nr:hypothetical protein SFRURICE_018774 [Spodoptera frugiperda]